MITVRAVVFVPMNADLNVLRWLRRRNNEKIYFR
jgi:hypothetical protein